LWVRRTVPFWITAFGFAAVACTEGSAPTDAGFDTSPDVAADADPDAGSGSCACLPGPHNERIYLMSQDAEVWTFDPVTLESDFVVGPVCGGIRPFSMAVDAAGVAWINDVDSLGIELLDLLSPGACETGPYLRRDMRYGLFGMSFATESAVDTCADLYVFTYDGDGPFEEGPGLGRLGAIDPVTGELRDITEVDYDGGELSGTGDGRLFAFTGNDPAKLVEYDKATGEVLETIPLDGFSKTNASAMAFYGGDLYLFVEAWPAGCTTCLSETCMSDYDACVMDDACSAELACPIEQADFRDDCGGLLPTAMADCLGACTEPCFTPPRARVSEVLRFDLDRSDGPERTLTRIVDGLPIRVVGAATSPCVPTGPI
jgi:hypothetical protein